MASVAEGNELVARVRDLVYAEEHDRADELVRRALSMIDAHGDDDERADARIRLAAVRGDTGDHESCIALCTDAVALRPSAETAARALRTRALSRCRQGRFDRALRDLRQVEFQKLGSGLRGSLRALEAEVLTQLGQLDKATKVLRAALRELGSDPDTTGRCHLHNALGELLRRSGRPKQARQHYLAALDGAPTRDKVPAWINLAILDLELGDLRSIAGHLRVPLAQHSDSGDVTEAYVRSIGLACHLGDSAAFLAELGHAESLLDRHELVDSDVAGIYERIGELARSQGAPELAVRCHARALRMRRSLGQRGDRSTCELVELAREGAPALVAGFDVFEVRRTTPGARWYRARHIETGRNALLKVFLDGGVSQRNVRAQAALDHPNILSILDAGAIGRTGEAMLDLPASTPFVAFAGTSEGPLSGREGVLRWPKVRQILVDLLGALAHAHARGFAHLELDGDRVLLDVGRARLADFVRLGSTERHGRAPEQIRQLDEVDGRADLYAVGCLAFELVCGHPPFSAEDAEALVEAHLDEEAPPLQPRTRVPDTLGVWVWRLLEKDPGDRFATAAHAQRALLKLDGGQVPPGVPERWRAGPPPGREWLGSELVAWREPPLRGRLGERDRLWDLLKAVDTAQAGVSVQITGPGGLGKSRLLTWLGRRVSELGCAHALEGLGGRRGAALAALRARTRTGTCVLLADEDPDTLELGLAAIEEGMPVLVVYASRDPHPDVSEEIPLGPLGRVHCAKLVDDRVPMAPGLRRNLVNASRGVPEYLVQLVSDWARRGLLIAREDSHRVRPGAIIRIPEGLEEAWRQRTRGLCTAAERRALRIAAALGPAWTLERWQATCLTMELADPAALLSRLVEEGLATPEPSFASRSLADSLLAEAAGHEELVRIHEACAEALADVAWDTDGALLAEHLMAVGRPEDAVAPYAAAALFGARSDWEGRADTLIGFTRSAMEAAGLEDHADLARAELEIARLRFEPDAQEAAATRLLGLGSPRDRVDARLALAGVAQAHNRNADALVHVEAAEEECSLPAQKAEALEVRGCILNRMGKRDEARTAFDEALSTWEFLGERARSATTLNYLAQMHGLDDPERERCLEESLKRSRSADHPLSEGTAKNLLAESRRHAGKPGEAEKLYREAWELLQIYGGQRAILAALNLGLVQIARGRYLEALQGARELDHQLQRSGREDWRVLTASNALPGLSVSEDEAEWSDTVAFIRHAVVHGGLNEADMEECARVAASMGRTEAIRDEARALAELLRELRRK